MPKDRFFCEFEHTFQLKFLSDFHFSAKLEIRPTFYSLPNVSAINFFICTDKLWCKFRMKLKTAKFAWNEKNWN